jgi:hypothetical protein
MATESIEGEDTIMSFALTHQNNDASLSALILDQEQPLTDKSPLSSNEKRMLENCETILKQNLNAFFQLGEVLATIKRMRLYRDQYSTFEEYCRKKWNFGRHRAVQLIQAHATASEMLTAGQQISGLVERQLRPLVPLDANRRAEVVEKARTLAGDKKLSTRHIKQAIEIVINGDSESGAGDGADEEIEPPAKRITTAVEMPIVTIDMLTDCFDQIFELLERVEFPDTLRNSFATLRSMIFAFAAQSDHTTEVAQ